VIPAPVNGAETHPVKSDVGAFTGGPYRR